MGEDTFSGLGYHSLFTLFQEVFQISEWLLTVIMAKKVTIDIGFVKVFNLQGLR